MVEEAETLRQRESVFRERRRFQRRYNLIRDLIETKGQVKQIPDVIGFLEKHAKFRIIQELLHAAKVEIGIGFAQLVHDVVATHCGVLQIWTGFAIEVQRLAEIEGDDLRSGELQEEVSQCSHRNLMSDLCTFRTPEFGIPLLHFLPS